MLQKVIIITPPLVVALFLLFLFRIMELKKEIISLEEKTKWGCSLMYELSGDLVTICVIDEKCNLIALDQMRTKEITETINRYQEFRTEKYTIKHSNVEC